MRTLQQIITEITRDAPSARVTGGQQTYALIEIPGSGGAHAVIYLAPVGENSIASVHHDADDKGRRITFKRGSAGEEEVIVALANFLVLHETIRDRRELAEKERNV